MNQPKLAFSAMGNDRNAHASRILQAATLRANYAALHNAAYEDAGQERYVVVNSDNVVVARAADPKALQTITAANAGSTIRHEDFLTIQDTVEMVRRRELHGIADLQAAGLSFPANITDQLVGFEMMGEHQAAKQEMNPTTYQNNNVVFTEDFVPNPITHQSFDVPWRQQGFNYKQSMGIDEMSRQVAERLEDTLFNGNSDISVTYGGNAFPIYGYTTHPSRAQANISDWSLLANVGDIVNELIEQVGLMWSTQGGVANDSVVVYVANDIWTNLQNDYKTYSERSVLARMLDVSQVRDVKPAEKLAATEVLLVEMRPRTVQLAVASDLIVVPHTKTDPMAAQTLTAYAAMVQQIKKDSNGKTGVRHLTVA